MTVLTVLLAIGTVYVLSFFAVKKEISKSPNPAANITPLELKKRAEDKNSEALSAYNNNDHDKAVTLFKEARKLYEDYRKADIAEADKEAATLVISEIDTKLSMLENSVIPEPKAKPSESELPKT